MESRIEISQPERDVLKVMSLVLKSERTQSEAARLLGSSVRQMRRIQRRLAAEGDGGVAHRMRRRPSNLQLCKTCAQILGVYRRELSGLRSDVGERGLGGAWPGGVRRHALALVDGSRICGTENVRGINTEAGGPCESASGSWSRWTHRSTHGWKGDERRWFSSRSSTTPPTASWPVSTRVKRSRRSSTWLVHGWPNTSDRWCSPPITTASSSRRPREKTRGTTQFSRAAHELGNELILAGSPQAKGRVEPSHGTHQDRWVKLLRLAGATTRAEANETSTVTVSGRRMTKTIGFICSVRSANEVRRSPVPAGRRWLLCSERPVGLGFEIHDA